LPKKTKYAKTPTSLALNDLTPLLDGMVKAEAAKAIGELQELVAGRIRTALAAALGQPANGHVPGPHVIAPAKPVVAKAPEAVKPAVAKRGRPATCKGCNVKGCVRPHRSQGYCGAHYQSARKYGWPTPAPAGFVPAPLKRGRPAKADAKKAAAPAK
jgi:hypothetical protein